MIISNCCCLKVATACADFAPYFGTGTLNNQIGKLVIGNLTVTGHTIGDYVIDWYLQGNPTLQFSTSNSGNTTAGIKAHHPLTGNNVYYVEKGIWLPKIRYMYVDGIKYTSYPETGSYYASDLLDCLPSVTVQNFTCINGGTGDYAHNITYTNAVSPPSLADMIFQLELDVDGSIKYIAFAFGGSLLADGLKIYYVSPLNGTSILIDWWVVGANVPEIDHSISRIYEDPPRPRLEKGKWYVIYTVVDISEISYSLGDYIQFEVSPSYYTPTNTNTNWTLSFTCLDNTSDVLNCDRSHTFIDLSHTIDTTSFYAVDAPSDPTCAFYPKFSLMARMTGTTDFFKYHGFFRNWAYPHIPASKDVTITMQNKKWVCGTKHSALTVPTQLQQYFVYTKVGNILKFNFKDYSDYSSYKSAYNYGIASPAYNYYTADDTSIFHFVMWNTIYSHRACTTGSLTNCTFSDSENTVTTSSAHGLENGYRILFNTIDSTTGIDIYTAYYVRNKTVTSFQVSLTSTGAIIDFIGNSNGSYRRLVSGFLCGDSATEMAYNFERNSTFVFDDVLMTITITILPTTNNVVDLPCDGQYEYSIAYSNAINNYYSSADTQYIIYCGVATPFGITYLDCVDINTTDVYASMRMYIPKKLVDSLCVPTGWCTEYIKGYSLSYYDWYYSAYQYSVRAIITNVSDRMNNWRLLTYLNPLSCPTSCTISGVTNTITTSVAHGLSDGTRIMFGTISSVTGINNTTVYYIINSTLNTFKVSLTLGGSEVDISGTSGTGTYGDIIYEISGGIVIES